MTTVKPCDVKPLLVQVSSPSSRPVELFVDGLLSAKGPGVLRSVVPQDSLLRLIPQGTMFSAGVTPGISIDGFIVKIEELFGCLS